MKHCVLILCFLIPILTFSQVDSVDSVETSKVPDVYNYVWAPGHGMEKGTMHYKNTLLIASTWTYALTNQFSMGVGGLPLIFWGDLYLFYWLQPQLTIPIHDKVKVGVGGWVGGMFMDFSSSSALSYYTVILGKEDSNVSIGPMQVFGQYEGKFGYTVRFLQRLGSQTWILGEYYNFRVDEYEGIRNRLNHYTILSMRRSLKKSVLDLGFAIIADYDYAFVMPNISFTIDITKSKQDLIDERNTKQTQ